MGFFTKAVLLLTLGLLGLGFRIGSAEAGHSHQGYFQYLNVPGEGQYEFGFHRGNSKHYISRYEQSKDWKFRTKVRWGDEKGGYGEHYFDYNHVDKHKHDDHGHHGHKQQHHHQPVHHHHDHGHGHGWHGGYSEPSAAVVPAETRHNSRGDPKDQLEVIYVPPTPKSPRSQPPRGSQAGPPGPENRRRLVLPQEWQEPMPMPAAHSAQAQPQFQHMRTQRRPHPQPLRSRRFYRRFRH